MVNDSKQIAEAPFISRLPQRLLSHPNGGALAVIGHVDRAFGDTFRLSNKRQLTVYKSVLKCLIDGRPVGYSMEFFDQQYAELASECNKDILDEELSPKQLASYWTWSKNARNYAIFGDPAVTIAVPSAQTRSKKKLETARTWFKPSGNREYKRTSEPSNIVTATSMEVDRVTELERKVEILETEKTQLLKTIEELKQQISGS